MQSEDFLAVQRDDSAVFQEDERSLISFDDGSGGNPSCQKMSGDTFFPECETIRIFTAGDSVKRVSVCKKSLNPG